MKTLKYFLIYFIFTNLQSSCVSLMGPPYQLPLFERDQTMLSGTAFIRSIRNKDEYQRELRIQEELSRGNIPKHLFKFVPVETFQVINGRRIRAKLFVSPDYLAIGSNNDYVRVPMNPITAQRVADDYGCILPTSKIVDLIYRQAKIKLKPATFRPSRLMVRTEQFVKHNRLIQGQLKGKKPSLLVAGHKKDVVISKRLSLKKQRVAIYGWHRLNGKAIQPLSTIHGNYYSDYSHGVRLVAGMMEVNGVVLPVEDVLQDASLAPLISHEGTLEETRYKTHGTWTRKYWMP